MKKNVWISPLLSPSALSRSLFILPDTLSPAAHLAHQEDSADSSAADAASVSKDRDLASRGSDRFDSSCGKTSCCSCCRCPP